MEVKQITTIEDLKRSFQLRIEVFVHEQGVPLEDELDAFDNLNEGCNHILLYYEGKAIGTGRIRTVDGLGKLERIVILKPYRKLGLGKNIIQKLECIAKEKGLPKVKLHGQTQAQGFYEKLGYQQASEVFMEDGIEHVLMTKELY